MFHLRFQKLSFFLGKILSELHTFYSKFMKIMVKIKGRISSNLDDLRTEHWGIIVKQERKTFIRSEAVTMS